MPAINPDTVAVVTVLAFLIGFPLFLVLYIKARRRATKLAKTLEEEKQRGAKELEKVTHEETQKRQELEARYAPIIDKEAEVARLDAQARAHQGNIDELRASYAAKHETLKRLEHQVAVYDDRLAFAELGVYEPHFDFGDSEAFKAKIKEVRDKQKAMVSAKHATLCPTDWVVEGSRSKGQTMIVNKHPIGTPYRRRRGTPLFHG
ncbi:coiled-coil domain-containing protein [Roseivivax sediminis]|uniref:SNIPE associated domain-containing protein n=1 Tax=Roseivivax sediminis TaxID=936889 RepID=A0A1I2ER77_9RHOB|nr:hypothetical protein [Roseivivax sediminis]SFE94821.1 hypothetical protein SAMN04515678_1298 [Roseivivax sediminis]